ncbi:NAD(P)/FAD-dependent oxidoreductase [Bordetella bronchiseptica]|uniref:NAD(P)/FAD-dependent oxidoreductase n=1 Tax=Bordetella bronchiseptica TaxID=518 RepID=UPI00081CC547|nr:FAD-binding oxidoreductase [Bordetella bronchiseptica]AOB26036.1 amino acid dehydrogenase [Bordetella bronchiseptica]AZW43319.1 FAD-binding oxidoreductase [Bordetella bronchiseptica]MBN3268762.1 FAD-binding oxidoreductase [Bordetella bronchiseptica]
MRTAVIGGGIVGVSTALTLRRSGHDVVLIERGDLGMGCSYGNGGAISPDFCVPLAMPGMLKRVPRWFSDPLGPLVVRWRHLPAAMPWLVRWVLQGRDIAKVRANSAAMRSLHRDALADYRTLLAGEYGQLIETTGQIYVWQHDRSGPVESLARQLRLEQGVEARSLTGSEIRSLDPHLDVRYDKGLFFPENGHTIDPLGLVRALAARYAAEGGQVVRDEFRRFELRESRAVAAQCAQGRHEADAFVIATGVDGARMARGLGDRVSMQAERGYHVMLPDPGVRPAIKISNRDHMFGLTPMAQGVRISGTVEIASADAPADYRRAQALLTRARQMYPGLNGEDASFWMGSRPSTPDSLPVIDRARAARNVIYAFGHGHSGLTGAPMTARMAAALLAQERPPIDPNPYRAARFH